MFCVYIFQDGSYFNTTGTGNTANGRQSLQSNTTGDDNTALGKFSGYSNSTGNANVFLGHRSGFSETGSNKLYIENTNADPNNALIYGDFGTDNTTTGNILRVNGQLQLGTTVANRYFLPTARGTASQILQTDGSGNMSWIDASSLGDQDWYEVGSVNPPDNINDNIFTQGYVGIRVPNPYFPLMVASDVPGTLTLTNSGNTNFPGTDRTGISNTISGDGHNKTGIENTLSGTGAITGGQIKGVHNVISANAPNQDIYAVFNRFDNAQGNRIYGMYNRFSSQTASIATYGLSNSFTGSPGTETKYGVFNSFGSSVQGSPDGILYGIRNDFSNISSVNTSAKHGSYTIIPSTAGGIHYGLYSDVQKSSGYAGYFIGRTSLGNTTSNRYLMPASDGAANYIMQTNGVGQVSFVNPTTVGTDDQDLTGATLTGTSLQIDIENGSFTIVDLATLQDGTGTDDQQLSLSGTELTIEDGNMVNLATILDGTGTDNQDLQLPTLSGTTLTLNIENGASTNIDLAPILDGDTQNTLDQAYDEGGAGAGKTITADNGAVTIAGEDGFLVTGTFGSGATGPSGNGVKMFFNPRKGAFRVGEAFSSSWDDSNIGDHSFASGSGSEASGANSTAMGVFTIASGLVSSAFGLNTIASGDYSTTMGSVTIASGDYSTAIGFDTSATGNYSTAMGNSTRAFLDNETTMGKYNTVGGASGRLFSIGNGTGIGNESNALEVFDTGLVTINEAYSLPTTDGTANYIMQTNGSGQVSFIDPATIGDGTGTDNQDLQLPTLSGTTLTLNIENGASTNIDLAPILDGTGTDDQQLSLSGTELTIEDGNMVNLAPILDGTGTDDQDLTAATLTGNDLLIDIENGNSITADLSAINGDITNVIAGDGLTGGGSVGDVTLNVVATNGLTDTADTIKLGGALTENTTITAGAFNIDFNLNSTGDFSVQDNGTKKLEVLDNGDTVLGGDLYFRDENTSGTIIARLTDTGNDGVFDIYKDGAVSNKFRGDGISYINGGSVGIGTTSPDTKLSVIGIITAAFETAETNKLELAHGGSNAYINVIGAGRLDFRHEGTTGMSFTDTNRLGIGTSSPDEDLSVSGVANLNEDLAAAGVALKVSGDEAIWYNDTRFSWGFGGTSNTFANDLGIGMTSVPSYRLDVRDNPAGDYVAQIYNTSTDTNADGLKIRVGRTTAPTGSNSFLGFFDGNNTSRGRVRGDGVGVQFLTTSDKRLKTNIKNITNALSLIKNIQPKKYEYKSKLGIEEYGFIAQELQPLYPQAVSGSPNSNVETDPMMVDYSRLTPLLTAGIKELKKEVDTLKEVVDVLKAENKELKTKLSNYESLEARLVALENANNTREVLQNSISENK